jgi:hypothetical protein
VLGPLTAVKATLPHPRGEIAVDFTQSEPGILARRHHLAPWRHGRMILGDMVYPLARAPQEIPQQILKRTARAALPRAQFSALLKACSHHDRK